MNMPRRWAAPETRLLLLASVFLSLGFLVYVFGRSTPAYFLPVWLTPTPVAAVSSLGSSLPAFAHTFAMILVTAAVLRPWPRTVALNCIAWCVLECCFELGQIDAVAARLAAAMPEWTGGLPVLGVAGDYFTDGTFDPLDIVACLLAAFIAYFVIRRIYQGAEP